MKTAFVLIVKKFVQKRGGYPKTELVSLLGLLAKIKV